MTTFDDEKPPCVASPCNECPWRKCSVPGHLGPYSAKTWVRAAHGEAAIACHKTIRASGSWEGTSQCAGAASFRANVLKTPRDRNVAVGPESDEVFETNEEFVRHHTQGEEGWEAQDMWNYDD